MLRLPFTSHSMALGYQRPSLYEWTNVNTDTVFDEPQEEILFYCIYLHICYGIACFSRNFLFVIPRKYCCFQLYTLLNCQKHISWLMSKILRCNRSGLDGAEVEIQWRRLRTAYTCAIRLTKAKQSSMCIVHVRCILHPESRVCSICNSYDLINICIPYTDLMYHAHYSGIHRVLPHSTCPNIFIYIYKMLLLMFVCCPILIGWLMILFERQNTDCIWTRIRKTPHRANWR